MVNVFIIHSGCDYDFVKKTVEPNICGQKKTGNNANILTLSSGKSKLWKHEASKKIKNS